MASRYEAIGSGKAGWLRTNIPCIRLAIYDNFLVIAFLMPTVIPLKNLSVTLKPSIFGVKFLSIKKNGQPSYVLSTRKPENALQLLHT